MLDRIPRWALHLGATLLTMVLLLIMAPVGPPYDDCAYVTAAHLATEGRPSDAYDQAEMNVRHSEIHPNERKNIGPFFYSPVFLQISAPLAGFSFEGARIVNQLLILLSLGGILFLLLQQTESPLIKVLLCLVFVISDPVVRQFFYLNWSAHLGLLVVLAIFLMKSKRDLPAAIAWALAIHLKAYVGLFFVPLLIVGRRRLVVTIVAAGIALILLNLPWAGIDTYTTYLQSLSDQADESLTYFFNQISVQATIARFEFPPFEWLFSKQPPTFPLLGWILWLSVPLYLAAVWRLRHDEWRALSITIPYLLLFVPKIWDHSEILLFALFLTGVFARRTKAILLLYLALSFGYFALLQLALQEAVAGTGSVAMAHVILLYYPLLNIFAAAAILTPSEESAGFRAGTQ